MTTITSLTSAKSDLIDPYPWTRRLGILLTVATFLLIGTGGLVTSYNAGLAVPDWPSSFGRWIFLPAKIWSDLAVMLEHNHRLMGQAAGLVCLATLIATILVRGWHSPATALAWAVLAAYLYQGVMGGLRVIDKSVPLAVVHGIQGQLLFIFVVALAGSLGKWPRRIKSAMASHTGNKPAISRAVYGLAWAFLVLLVMQLAFGAIIRHTHSASAIPDAPAVYGGFLPPSDPTVIEQKFFELGGGDWRVYAEEPALTMEAVKADTTPNLLRHAERVPATPPTVALVHNQYMHRVMGMLILPIMGMILIHLLIKSYNTVPGLRGPVALISILFVLQVLLGLSVIWSKELPYIASTHQALGAAILGLATMVLLRLHWARKFSA